MGRKKPTTRQEENSTTNAPTQGGAGKSKKKAVLIDDDEYSVGTELSEEQLNPSEQVAPVAPKKKGKKGNTKKSQLKDDDDDDEEEKKFAVEEDDDVPTIQFAGKKKSKPNKSGKSSVFSASSFGLLGDEDEDDDDEDDEDDENSSITRDKDKNDGDASEEEAETVVAFTGKKKSSKSKKASGMFASIGDEDDTYIADDDEVEKQSDDEEPVIAFTGKKKSSKSTKKNAKGFSAAFAGEDNGEDASVSKFSDGMVDADDEEASVVAFSGKKKSSKKKNNSDVNALENVPRDDKVNEAQSEQTNSGTSSKEIAEISKNQEVAETSKNKKKKKKGARTVQEEDDLDKILAELGEKPAPASAPGPAPSSAPGPAPQEEKAVTEAKPAGPVEVTGEKEADEGGVETAAAKKKKKKKEKEKEKKAAAAAAPAVEEKQEAAKGKVADKKVSKAVREMQEKLARQKEAEERKKREEEEKLRKEEEERRKEEELERLAEEKKRLKREKEKERIQRRKQEGTFLTAKQKEEARRRELMRNQILSTAGGLPLPTSETGTATKRPIYKTKKSKAHPQGNGSISVKESTEPKDEDPEVNKEVEEQENVDETDLVNVDVKNEDADVVEDTRTEEDDEDELDEWDAKSWDDADLKLPAISPFDDEETESEPGPVVKKESKNAKLTTNDTKAANPIPEVNPAPVKPEEMVKKSNTSELTVKKPKVGTGKNEEPKSTETGTNLRSPICCIMGHVDTGKTKLLDCIRGTNVQEGEAGGITQQIGATYFPAENIRDRTKELKADAKLNVPGLLVIDTPGHESFTNLRSRGSGLCDIAILVVDIMHGLEPQTIESLNLLRMRNTEFIVALNKVDRLYGWRTCHNSPIFKALKQQSSDVVFEFNNRLSHIKTQFMEQGLNTELYYKNKEMGETFSIVPTSAISGEGIPDLLLLLIQWTQKTMTEKLTYRSDIQCTVLEVKVVEGHGTTIDVILVNGTLHEGDQIVVCGMQGPIATSIRALLTPHPMKELRVKGTYLHHKEIKAAQGIKITAQGLEHAIAGTALYVVGPDDDVEDIKESAMEDMRSVMSRIDKSGEGVCVQASTLGSLEALLEFLKTPVVNIPVSGISIGPVHKKDVMKASVMLEKKKEYATILAFDVKVTPEARELADEVGVRIFIADIIYHLFDQFKAYIDTLKEEKKKETAEDAVFPCVLRIIPDCIFNKKDPIVLGVDILEGILKIGTPICIPQKDFIDIGRIASIENNHKPVDYAKKGQKVAIKIIGNNSEEQQKMFGRHFELEDELVSHISRRSIDILKTNYRDDLSNDEWRLVVKLKNLFKIQ